MALGLQAVVTIAGVAVSGPIVLPMSSIALLAIYLGWAASVPNPPKWFFASLHPLTPTVEIGDAWNVPPIEPSVQPSGLARVKWGQIQLDVK